MTRPATLAITLSLALTCLSCAGRPVTSTDVLSASSLTGPIPPTTALFDLRIEPVSLSAEVMMVHSSAGQPPQNLRYDLDIDKFLTPDTLQVAGLRLDNFEDIAVTLRHRHPFPAPNFSAGITAKNRADLGYTGRLFFLSERQVEDYGEGITLDRNLVRAPHGYASPGDLLRDAAGLTASHYPYVLLVDEAIDNREGISNGGLGRGSYDAPSGGWQLSNAGPDGRGWTGYDYLHGGQASLPRFTIRRTWLEANAWTVRLALVIQWTDPRGAGGPSRRFPTDPADVTQFAYRMPYGALDVSQVLSRADWQLRPDTDQPTSMTIFVRDWDVQSEETAEESLGTETDVSKVQPGGAGLPTVEFLLEPLYSGKQSVPYVSGSGKGADWLIYRTDLVDQNQVRQPGVYTGLILVTDPEYADANRENYHAGVDAETLVPDAARRLEPRTVQPFTVLTAFDAAGWVMSWGDLKDEHAQQVAVDSTGLIAVASQYRHQAYDAIPGDFHTANSHRGGYDIALARFTPSGDYLGSFTYGGNGDDLVENLAYDAAGRLVMHLRTNSTSFDVDLQAGELDLGGPTEAHLITRYDAAGEIEVAWRLPQGDGGGTGSNDWLAFKLGPDDSFHFGGFFEGTADFDPGAGAEERSSSGSGGNSDACLLKLNSDGTFGWVRIWGDTGDAHDRIADLAVLGDGGVFAGGELSLADPGGSGTVDLDPSAGEDLQRSHSMGAPFYVRLDAAGGYLFGSSWLHQATTGGEVDGSGYLTRLTFDESDRLYLCGYMAGGGDFDPGPGEALLVGEDFQLQTNWVYSLTNVGDYRWAFILGKSSILNQPDGPFLINADGHLLVSGAHNSSATDYDPGPGTANLFTAAIYNSYLASYTADGDFRYVKLINGLVPWHLQDLYQMADGDLLLCGGANSTVDIDPDPVAVKLLTPEGRADAYFMRLDRDLNW